MKEKSGVLACYLKDRKTGRKYGLTALHVTLCIEKCLTIKTTKREEYFHFGRRLPVLSSNQRIDVDIFEIEKDYQKSVNNKVIGKNGDARRVKVYAGPIESLYGRRVKKLIPCFTDLDTNPDNLSKYAQINDAETHREYCNEGTFVVKGETGPFSVPGYSGTPIVLDDNVNTDVILVGFIVGGGDSEGNYDTTCIFLPNGISILEQHYDMSLTAHVYNSSIHNYVPIGSRIFVNCPGLIIPTLDLIDLVISLATEQFKECSLENYSELLKKEKKFKQLVYNGKDFTGAADSDSPIVKAIVQGLKGCLCTYLGLPLNTKHFLQQAFLNFLKCKDFKLRIFGKNICYLTKYLVFVDTKESNQRLADLLVKIAHFHRGHTDKRGYPTETGVSLFLDISKYHQNVYDNVSKCTKRKGLGRKLKALQTRSVKWAKLAVELALEIDLRKKSKFSAARLSLAKCELVSCLLGYGHTFGNTRYGKCSEQNLKKASNLMESIDTNMDDFYIVHYLTYLIAKCDLQYCRADYKSALKAANECHSCAVENKLLTFVSQSFNRQQVLIELANTDRAEGYEETKKPMYRYAKHCF